jgi:hypothetical protein
VLNKTQMPRALVTLALPKILISDCPIIPGTFTFAKSHVDGTQYTARTTTAYDMPLPSPPNLRGKVAIVTGGSRGIGREVCLALARAGCSVVIAAKSATPQPTLPGTIHTVAKEVEALGGKALPVVVDLRDEAACVACVAQTVATFGGVVGLALARVRGIHALERRSSTECVCDDCKIT